MKGRGRVLVKLRADWEYVEEAQSECNVITWIMTKLCMCQMLCRQWFTVHVKGTFAHTLLTIEPGFHVSFR